MLRLTLENEASDILSKMFEELKSENPGLSLSPSGLAGWIIIYFSRKQFARAKERVAREHFNPKAFMRSRLRGLDSREKFQEFLNEVKLKMKNNKGAIKEKANKELTAAEMVDRAVDETIKYERNKK